MKTLLICPALRPAVSRLAETVPLAAVPIFGECLVNFWIEYLAGHGARHIIVLVVDRLELVRAAVGDGRRWGVEVEFVSAKSEPTVSEAVTRYHPENETGWMPVAQDVVVMNYLPESAEFPLFSSYAAWFAALEAWIPRAHTPTRVRMNEVKPGIWIGSGARVAPTAQLRAPCWIGDHVTVEADAVIGPGAILEDRVVIGAGACVTQSVIGPDTFVGRLTAVMQSLAEGSLLINWRSGSILRVPDSFLLCSLVNMPSLVPATAMSMARTAMKPLKFFKGMFSRTNRADAP